MRRATLVLGLTFSAVVLVALVYGIASHRSPSAVKYPPESVDTKPHASTVVEPQSPEDDSQKGDESESPLVNEAGRNTSLAEEASTRKWVREETTREVQEDYALLFQHLDLPSSEGKALLEFLIEDAIARTKTAYSSGIGLAEHERSARIAEIIGEAKLQQFLALEHNLGEYRDVQYVQSDLQQKSVPLTDTQQNRLLKIMIDTREQVDMTRPEHIERGSIESLEHTLDQLDEYDRLVLELASSVLSAKQVEHLFERYQAHSYRRAAALESQKQRRADNPGDELLLGYPSKRD